MANLKTLTVLNLKKLANDNNIKLRSKKKVDIIAEIKNANLSDYILEDFISKNTNKRKKKTSVKKSSKRLVSKDTNSDMELRVNRLEKQVKYLIAKIESIDLKITDSSNENYQGNPNQTNEIKLIITAIIPRNKSISMDNLKTQKKLRKFNWIAIEKAVSDLIDEEIFDGTESRSNFKVNNRIGRIIRR